MNISKRCLYADQDSYADVLADMASGYLLFPKAWYCLPEVSPRAMLSGPGGAYKKLLQAGQDVVVLTSGQGSRRESVLLLDCAVLHLSCGTVNPDAAFVAQPEPLFHFVCRETNAGRTPHHQLLAHRKCRGRPLLTHLHALPDCS